ncbi:nucleolin-like [Papaver somniferum]|uniref:nucleolin-like n=1 Tax=Papaver somniferum TaxID=3469 RepID=UPI000E702312|nr:nucleolin-like [Papaver somniferum]
MARTKQTTRKENQIPNLVDAVNAAKVAYSREMNKFNQPEKSNQPPKEMAPIRCSKNKKDKLAMVTPPSRPPRHGKYLNASLLRGKTPSEVALFIREPRDPCGESSESSTVSPSVISATGSDEEEVAEHEEIPLGSEYAAYDDDDDGDDGKGGYGDNGGNHGNKEAEIEEEQDEEGDEDNVNGNERNDGGSGDEEEEEIQEVEEDAAQPQPKKKIPIAPSARHIPPKHLQLTRLSNGKSRGEPKDDGKVLFGYDSSWARTINETIVTFLTLLFI